MQYICHIRSALLLDNYRLRDADLYNTFIQRKAVSKILERLDPDDRLSLLNSDQRSRTGLERAIQQVKEEHFPTMICHQTIERLWLNHYLLYGETPCETMNFGKKNRKRKRMRRWTDEDRNCLRQILDEHPELYLDEICDQLFISTGKLFCTTSIYENMMALGYSLKVAFEKASQRDEVERGDWRAYLLERRPNNIYKQLVFMDETHKSVKETRRRRQWVLKRRGRPFYEAEFLGEDRDFR